MSERKYLTDKEVAIRYAVSRGTIWNWVREGILPPGKKFCRSTRWDIDDLLRFEQSRRSSR